MRRLLATLSFLALIGAVSAAHAADRDKEGYITTGSGVRVKKVAFVNVKVYDIKSLVKELPSAPTKEGMIGLDADKKLQWTMLRTVDAEKFRNALRDAYSKNGYRDTAKIEKLLQPIQGEIKEGAMVTIAYDAGGKRTTLYSEGRQSSVEGADFMRATWSIWFGNIDQPNLSKSLLDNLK